jgi:hypothetical protein
VLRCVFELSFTSITLTSNEANKTRNEIMSDDDSDGFLEDDSGGSGEDIVTSSKKRKADKESGDGGKKKKKSKPSWIDDAAEESGDEASDDEEEEDEDAPNDYERDGFVVDEDDDDGGGKKDDDGLEDSDDDDDDDDDDGEGKDRGGGGRLHKKTKRIRRMDDRLDDDDLALINEAKGIDTSAAERERIERERIEAAKREKIVARSEAELRKGLFYDSGDEDGGGAKEQQIRKPKVERYDEDGMDDFIDDDIGDQADIMNSEIMDIRGEGRLGEVSEAQMNEASEIFGTDYLQFMAQNTGEGGQQDDYDDEEAELMGSKRYREKGVGVNLGVDSEEEISDDDDDLFDDDDDDEDDLQPGISAAQRAEALKLKRQKRELAKKERREKALQKKMEKRKAQLRKAFEPVQLIENFCTDRDDEIRRLDVPERFFDQYQQQQLDKTALQQKFPAQENAPVLPEEQEEAEWILKRIPAIANEYRSPPPQSTMEGQDPQQYHENAKAKNQAAIVESIVYALRYMLRDHCEPMFVQRYRADRVTSQAVRDSLQAVLEEDSEWERMKVAKAKVEILLDTLTQETDKDEAAGSEEETILQLQSQLEQAKEQLDSTAKKETTLQAELAELKEENKADDDDDDDDNLFGNDDDDEDNEKKKEEEEEEVRQSCHCSSLSCLDNGTGMICDLKLLFLTCRRKGLEKNARGIWRST